MRIFLERFPLDTAVSFIQKLETNNNKVIGVSLFDDNDSASYNLGCDLFSEFELSWSTENRDRFLTSEAINFVCKYEGIACSITSRYLFRSNLNIEEHIQHFHHLVSYWINYVQNNEIELVVHHFVPHTPSSFALYVASKYLQIHVLFVDVAPVLNKYKYLSASISDRSLLLNFLKNSEDIFILPIEDELLKIQQDDPHSLPKAVREIQQDVFQNMLGKKPPTKKHGIIEKIIRVLKNKNKIKYLRYGRNKDIFSKKTISYFKYVILLLHHRKRVKDYKVMYSKFVDTNLPKKFVYYAACAQPEATTLPLALFYRNQLNFINQLLAAIPQEVQIVVKENPTMFTTRNPYITAVNWREEHFISQLANKSRITLIDNSFSSRDLIKRSLGVASINGTVGLEALAFNRPCIINASTWYDRLPNIFKNNSIDQLRKFVSALGTDQVYYKENVNLNYKVNRSCLLLYQDHNTETYSNDENDSFLRAVLWYVENSGKLKHLQQVF